MAHLTLTPPSEHTSLRGRLLPPVMHLSVFQTVPWLVDHVTSGASSLDFRFRLSNPILDVSAAGDIDLGVWLTVSSTSPCIAQYTW